MSIFVSLGIGPKIFVELARWADTPRGVDIRRENGEVLIWLGKLHVIYTPARWRPEARGPTPGQPTRGGPTIDGQDTTRGRLAA
ncbi:MAG: hypothetical protein RLY86_3846 [Pseudomonadota bacterium]|jgi:hypothetical protein